MTPEELAQKKEELKKHIEAKNLVDAEISHEMRKAYIDYAMSVIVSRALPSAEDGLKPVHRRILWAMNLLGLDSGKQTKKSARIVGDVIGKFHPHGDTAVYDALVRMAQDFSLRYPLIIGQGNFGSMDGDPPAAMRYTEAKMEKISAELIKDIEKKTCEMLPNFDNSLEEPKLLPGKLPQLLLNGAAGIAVGMATNMPPHNLTNVCDCILKYIEKPNCEIDELIEQIQAPDFPTGGYLSGAIDEIYKTGRGRVVLRGKTKVEEPKKSSGKTKIVISELPYQVNKAKWIEEVAELGKNKKLPDVSDIRDESAKGKVRIVVELRKGADPLFTENRLYKYTRLQTNFDAVMLALVNDEPKQLTLKQLVEVYVNYRKKVITKATHFDLDKAQRRIHIVEGLLIAQDNIDAVIKLIKANKTAAEASKELQSKYKLSEKQAQAILEMRLQSLTSLESGKLKEEEKNLKITIEGLEKILSDEKEVLKIIKSDLKELKKKYGDERRTQIRKSTKTFEEKDLVKKKNVVVTITDRGYIKRLDLEQYKEQRRGGKGVIGSDLSEGDFVRELLPCSTHDYLLFFTNKGKVHWLKAYQVPESNKSAKGKAIVNLLSLKDEIVTSVISVKSFEEHLLVMATQKGVIKKIALKDFSSPRKGGVKAMKLVENNDTLISVKEIETSQELVLVSKEGQACRFNSDNVRTMGRASYGVTGIKLNKGDEVVSLEVIPKDKEKYSIFTITSKGYGKRSLIDDYRLTSRGGKGVINIKVSDKTGKVVTSQCVQEKDTVIVTTEKGMVIRSPTKGTRIMGRATQGVKVINLKAGDKVADLVRISEED
jgi:DNA gyrase subunit A